MINSIKIDYFPDGFSLDEIPCDALTIAHAISIFDKSLYYQYCVLESISRLTNNLWYTKFDGLEYLNIEFVNAFDKNFNSFFDFLKYCISIGVPLLLHTNYNCIYYSDGYKKENTNNHIIMFTGLNDEMEIVQVQDYELIEWYDIKFTKGQIYYRGVLTASSVKEIITNTKKIYSLDDNTFYKEHCRYLASKKSIIKHTNKEILYQFISNKEYLLCELTNRISTYSFSTYKNVEKDFHYIRIRFLGAFRVIFSFIITNFNLIKSDCESISDFLKELEIILALWQKNILKDKTLYVNKLCNMTDDLRKRLIYICDVLTNKYLNI